MPPKIGVPRKATCHASGTRSSTPPKMALISSVASSTCMLASVKSISTPPKSALNFLARHSALDAAKNGRFAECRPGIASDGRRGRSFSCLHSAPHEHQACCDQQDWPDVVPAKVTNAQLIELKKHSSGDQQNAPEAALARHEIWDACADQKQRPESPQPVDGNDAHVVKEEGDSAQNQECTPEKTARAPAADMYCRPDRAALFSLIFGACLHAVVNIAMDSVVEVIAELVRIEFILVTHQRSPIAEEHAPALYAANRPQNTSRSSTVPMMMRISGQHGT